MNELKPAVLVTGGAGFIGSNLVDKLISNGRQVYVFDDLSAGKMNNLKDVKDSANLNFVKVDLKNKLELEEEIKNIENKSFSVYHLAGFVLANVGTDPKRNSWQNNVDATYNLLESLKNSEKFNKKFYFSSSGAVYGNAKISPTNENYGPLLPISIYASGKLACEGLVSTYCDNYQWKGVIFRFANVVGKNQGHGVIYDFINKLKKNPNELEILGDGMQSKSYMHVSDCVSAMLFAESLDLDSVNIFNLASKNATTVDELAKIVIENVGLSIQKVNIKHTGGLSWKGDVTQSMLDTNKIKSMGFAFSYDSNQSIGMTVKQLLETN